MCPHVGPEHSQFCANPEDDNSYSPTNMNPHDESRQTCMADNSQRPATEFKQTEQGNISQSHTQQTQQQHQSHQSQSQSQPPQPEVDHVGDEEEREEKVAGNTTIDVERSGLEKQTGEGNSSDVAVSDTQISPAKCEKGYPSSNSSKHEIEDLKTSELSETLDRNNNCSRRTPPPRTPIISGSPGPKGTKKSLKCTNLVCNGEIEELMKRVTKVEEEKQRWKQKTETLETHQNVLRETVVSLEDCRSKNEVIIEELKRTVESQKKVISTQEISIASHTTIGSSLIEQVLADKNQDPEPEEPLKQLYDRIKFQDEQLASCTTQIAEMESASEKMMDKLIAAEDRLSKKSKEFNGLRVQYTILEESILSMEESIKNLQTEIESKQVSIESITIDNSKLRDLLLESEKNMQRSVGGIGSSEK